jgi:hypothetical protein
MALGALGAIEACSSTDVAPESDAGPGLTDAVSPRDASRPNDATVPDAGPRNLPCAIEAIFTRHCLECHDGSLDLPRLVTHEDLGKRLPTLPDRSLGEVALEKTTAERGFMPPPPRARVSAEDVAALKAWLEAGSPRGTCPERPALDAGTGDAADLDAAGD